MIQITYEVVFKKLGSIKFRGNFHSLESFDRFVQSKFNFSDTPKYTIIHEKKLLQSKKQGDF